MGVVRVNNAYQLNAKTGDAIQVGDPADSVFSPKATLNRWNGECWLKFGFDDSEIAQKSVQLTADNKVQWSTPLFDFRFYGIDEGDGGLEFEIVLKVKPSKNTFSFPLQAQNLKFYYQPPLTQEFNPADCVELSETHALLKNGVEANRPESVVGSYAVYHATRTNLHRTAEDAEKYKAGKAFHVYRPKLTDADGKTAWASFNDDVGKTGVLTITLPQDFLDSAKYPVVVDPTFGETGIGESQITASNATMVAYFELPEDGDISKLTGYCDDHGGGTINVKGVIYDDSSIQPINLDGTANEIQVSTAQWYDMSFPSVVSEPAAFYWIGYHYSGSLDWYFDSGEGTNAWKFTTYGDPPNPFGGHTDRTDLVSIYATYTSGGTLQTVTDSLLLSDSMLRHKTLILSDSLGLDDLLFGNKSLLLSDSASLSELVTVIIGEVMKYVTDAVSSADLVSTPSRVLRTLEAIGATDNVAVNKVLQITETVSLAEIVEVGVGGVKKTRLFLILGDLAVQLTGD